MNNKWMEEFPALKKYRIYLNTAGTGLLPKKTAREIEEFTEKTLRNNWENMENELVKPARKEICKLINCSEDEVSFSVQTTDGLKRILLALNPKPGMNIVGVDLEFPSISMGVKTLCRNFGCKVKIIRHRNGVYYISDFEKAIDENTLAVAISSVQWINGTMINLKEISRIAHEKGALVIVDGIQHVGAVKLDVKETDIDAMAVGGEKWLLTSNIGSGFIYVKREIMDRLNPPIYGLLNFEEPYGGWGEWWPLKEKDLWKPLRIARDVSKLDWGGGKPYILIAALKSCIEYINDLGIDWIDEHNKKLKHKILDEALSRGYEIVGFTEDKRLWSSITTISLGLKYEDELNLARKLREKKMMISYRGAAGIGGIRISPHLYNEKAEIETLMEEMEKIRRRLNKN